MENVWAVSLHGIYKINIEDLIVYYELNVNQDIVKTWYIWEHASTAMEKYL